MRLSRDVSGAELAKALKILGYQITRQTGGHLRLTTSEKGVHHVTIPNHSPLRIGTFAAILDDIADHFAIGRQELLSRINL